jgi:GxxExxY protein
MLDGPDELNALTETIIGAAIKVHTRLGPGLLEHTYSRCLKHEMEKAGLEVLGEVLVDLKYDDLTIYGAYRIDLLIEQKVVVEVKAIEKVMPVHYSQVLTYLKLTNRSVGLLFNFNVTRLPDGMKRLVNDLT